MKKNDNWIIQLRKGMLEIAILSLIHEKPMYGYEITSSLNKVPVFQIPNGSIYPILNRITKNNWVITYWKESNDGPKRKYYQITKEGTETLKERIEGYKEIYQALIKLKEGEKIN
ncbi:PadR family transcriptional regulator [Bacillus mycoides]|uniref:PadR family transcriptional regulator n=1 Tax=Bacillus mycoides TaxID=1405 RepID=UPI003D06F851